MGGVVPELTVVVPAHNEEGNVGPLIDEIAAALEGRIDYEIVFIDDASRDGTRAALIEARARHRQLRLYGHGSQSGQSAAIRSGVMRARGAWIATLDGDGQNVPADILKLLDARACADSSIRCFAGWRVARKDGAVKRITSTIANAVRSRLLADGTPDTGCGLKLFERSAFLELPYFDHMHRYLPALFRRAGYGVVSVPVGHRRRIRGASNYGTVGRLAVAFADLNGVAWLIRRSKRPEIDEL